jgi:hypothetical protein
MVRADLKDLLKAVNRAQADGVIDEYALGGTLGAMFYLEPTTVPDAEIFVKLPRDSAGSVPSVSPIYEYFASRGDVVEGDVVTIASWPTKFLSLASDLVHEGFNESVPKEVDGVKTWVMTPEHLVGIALQSGRPQDLALASQVLDSEVVDRNKLHLMLHRFGLGPQWHQFSSKYLEARN